MGNRIATAFCRDGNLSAWLVLISETSVMVFTLVRRPTSAISINLVIYAIGWTAQIRRIVAKEALLSRDAADSADLAQAL